MTANAAREIDGVLPSRHGLPFANAFPSGPTLTGSGSIT